MLDFGHRVHLPLLRPRWPSPNGHVQFIMAPPCVAARRSTNRVVAADDKEGPRPQSPAASRDKGPTPAGKALCQRAEVVTAPSPSRCTRQYACRALQCIRFFPGIRQGPHLGSGALGQAQVRAGTLAPVEGRR